MSLLKRTVWAVALLLISAVVIGNALISYRNTAALAAGMSAGVRSRDALNALDDVLQVVTDAETGQRGYLLTGRDAYLEPFVAARKGLESKVDSLRRLVASEPAQLARFEKLDALIAQQFVDLQRSVDLNKDGHREEATQMVATDAGVAVMHDIRETAEQMRHAESMLQVARDRYAAELYDQSQFNRILGALIGLGLVFVAGLLLRRDLIARARAAKEIYLQREWFSTTLGSIGDAVIVTDPQGCVQLINPVAADLTGWTREEAKGRDLLDIFDIVDEATRERADNPVQRALADGRVAGLANHTLLRSRSGREYAIEDSAAPTYDAAGELQGAVLVFHDATERRRSDSALSAAVEEIAKRAHSALDSERTLKTILDNAPIGICMTGPAPDFRIAVLSSQMRDWIGAAENMPALAVYRKLLPDGREPPPDLIPLNRVMHQGQLVRDEPWLIERHGAPPLTVIVNVAPVRDEDGKIVGAVHSWMDLTERQRLDHDLRVSQSRLSVLLESKVIGLILSFDSEGKVAQANRAFYDMLGFNPGNDGEILDLVAQTPDEYHAADQRAFAELRAVGFCAPYEKEFISRVGARRVSVVVGYAKVAETEDEFVGFALDISARKSLEGKLREQANELLAADRRKDEFLAMLAHELRNPLAPLRNAIHLLDERRHEGGTSVVELLPMMRRQIDHLVRLVDDLLDAARISQGKIGIDKTVIELAPSLRSAVESIQPLIDEREQRLEVDLGVEPLHVYGDAARLMQMVSNMLHNAAKYTQRRGNVRLTMTRVGDEAAIQVRDDGRGIASELLPRIFDTFVQDDQSLARSAGGLGVGLALVRRLSELHGGRVSATSAGPGQGSAFDLRLPLADAPVAVSAAGPEVSTGGGAGTLRVLVVDDNADLAASTVALLDLWGHEVREVHNGREALDVALAFRPDVILLDIGLPDMDGFEVARQLTAVAELERTQLIAMTGYGQERDRQRSAEAGFDAHLVKPVLPTALKALLDRIAG
ncbi:MAG: CHASE3 domain-containing protein [Rudaea sp.]